MPKTNKRVDLTDKNALVAAFNKNHKDLWAAFGTAPLYKDYDTNRLLDFIESLIKKENVHISPEKKEEIFDNIKKKGKNVKLVLQYVANVFLKGAGLGLGESTESRLRSFIREEIRRILAEKDLGERGSEKMWNSDFEEKTDFLKKINKQKFIGLSFKELPGSVQKAWEDYITK